MSKVLVVADNAKVTAELVAAAGSAVDCLRLAKKCPNDEQIKKQHLRPILAAPLEPSA